MNHHAFFRLDHCRLGRRPFNCLCRSCNVCLASSEIHYFNPHPLSGIYLRGGLIGTTVLTIATGFHRSTLGTSAVPWLQLLFQPGNLLRSQIEPFPSPHRNPLLWLGLPQRKMKQPRKTRAVIQVIKTDVRRVSILGWMLHRTCL